MPATRILIFGGSFDPPHRGHLALLKAAAKRLKPDRLLIVPAFQSPWKAASRAPAEDRLAMARLLIAALPGPLRRRASLDTSELLSRRKIYTVETLTRLARQNPGAELHFLVGSDLASRFSQWRSPKTLRKLASWWTANRPGFAQRAPSFFHVLSDGMPDISSTQLRDRLALGEKTDRLLWPALEAFARRRGLYADSIAAQLKESLSELRFRHSLAVSRLAEDLARRWSLSPQKAKLAGLLHDCGRSVPLPRLLGYARKNRLKIPGLDGIARHNPLLLHAYVGEDIARRRFAVDDKDVLSAIRHHTLGSEKMGPLDRVLYVADSCSEDRDYPQAAGLRRLAFEDLGEAFRGCVLEKIKHALSEGAWIHPLTISVWNSLQA